MRDASAIWRALLSESRVSVARLDIDLSRVTFVDGTVISLVVALREQLSGRAIRCELVGARPDTAQLVHLFGGDSPVRPVAKIARARTVTRLGAQVARMLRGLRTVVELAGDIAVATARIIRHPRSGNWPALPALIARAGTDGVPIVMLLNFLVGFVMAYQSTALLKLYGANIYVADIIGISITRELGPLITAIIIAGRSGAGFAAELGTMRVSEEIDALRTLGISPVGHLVLPRIMALALIAPALTLLGDLVGIAGGLTVAAISLDVTPTGYLNELRQAVVISDVWTGLVKSVAFGATIAFIGCQQGLATRGAASGVGRSTTTTVVLCLFALVIIDTLFTVFFRLVNA